MTKPTHELDAATALALPLLESGNYKAADYRLIHAQNVISVGPQLWRLRFKARRLIPATADSEIGAGGEVEIEVDLAARSARWLYKGD